MRDPTQRQRQRRRRRDTEREREEREGPHLYLGEHGGGEQAALHAQRGVVAVEAEFLDLVEQDDRAVQRLVQ